MRCLTVIVHHRGREILEACVESLLREISDDDRIVVFGNGLEEPLPEVVRHPRILVDQVDVGVGFSEANNLAVQAGRERWGTFETYFFLNNDTRVHPGALDLLHRALRAHPACAIVGPQLVIDGHEGLINSLGLNVTRHAEAWDEGIGLSREEYGELPEPSERLAVTGAALLARADVFHELGEWSRLYGYYFEDIDLCIRAWQRGYTVRLEPNAIVAHRVSASSGGAVSEFKTLHSWRNQIVLFLLHWPVLRLVRDIPTLAARQTVLYFRRRRVGAVRDASLQAKAIRQALTKLPTISRQRLARRHDVQWTRFLREPGTVPVIQLPDADAG